MLGAAATLLLIDVWQAALRAPGSLSVASLAWLAGLYLAAAALGALVLRGILRCSTTTTRALLLAMGGGLFAAETVLRTAGPLSPARPWLLAACVVVALAAVVALRALGRRPMPVWLVAGAIALLAVGAVGAVRGFGTGAGEGTALRGDAASPALRDRPNLILIVIDTLRADHLGCYGYARSTSPVLDRLASEGLLFERAYAQSSWTKPATASIFTGRLPSQHRVLFETSRLPESERTIPEALRDVGYRTAVFSANPWVASDYGFGQGVDDFVSVYDERFAHVTLLMTTLRRVSQVVDGRMRLYNRVKYLVLGELSTTARDTRLVDAAFDWLAAHRDERFFLYLHLMSPHHPYDPPPPFDRFVPDPTHVPVKNYPRKTYDLLARGDPLPAADLADMVARYDGDVLYADAEVGRFLARLDDLGLTTRTALVVTADHGEEFYEHGNWGHGQSVYNELIRIPLLVRYPGRVSPGVRNAGPVSHTDLLPTLLELAGAPPAPATLAASLLPIVGGDRRDHESSPRAFAELLYRYGEARALVERSDAGERKLVAIQQGAERRTELYDLATDPGEQKSLSVALPEAGRLSRELELVVAAATSARSAAADAAVDDDTRARLRALGYAR